MNTELESGTIHIWVLRISQAHSVVKQLNILLSDDERARASRFHFAHLADAFITARGTLRKALEAYTGTPAGRTAFVYGEKGKPRLAGPSRIQFNISHSGDIVLLAFALDVNLGIDVERIRPVPDREQIASRFFCREETCDLVSLAVADQERGFFLCWTRKEAYVKALGDGLSAPLDAFQVSVAPGEPARFIRLPSTEEWNLHNLDLDPDYAAAVAYPGPSRQIVMRNALDLLR